MHTLIYSGPNISSQASYGVPQADRLRRLQAHRHRAGPGQGGTDGVAHRHRAGPGQGGADGVV